MGREVDEDGTPLTTDEDRINFLESRVIGYGVGVTLRKRTTAKGALALHEIHEHDAAYLRVSGHTTVRAAIDAAMKESA